MSKSRHPLSGISYGRRVRDGREFFELSVKSKGRTGARMRSALMRASKDLRSRVARELYLNRGRAYNIRTLSPTLYDLLGCR